MKKIVLQGNTALNEVRESFGRWYYSLNEPYGDLYDAEEIEKNGRTKNSRTQRDVLWGGGGRRGTRA